MTPFSLILSLLTHYFHKILDSIGSKFVSRAVPEYLMKYPPPGVIITSINYKNFTIIQICVIMFNSSFKYVKNMYDNVFNQTLMYRLYWCSVLRLLYLETVF